VLNDVSAHQNSINPNKYEKGKPATIKKNPELRLRCLLNKKSLALIGRI